MQRLLSAVSEAHAAGAITLDQRTRIEKELAPAPLQPAKPAVSEHVPPQPPPRDASSVRVPPSFYVSARLSPRTPRGELLAALAKRDGPLSWERVRLLRLTCADLYHLGCTSRQLPRIDTKVLLSQQVALSDLALYFGVTRDELLEYSGFSPANLLACVRSAEECATVGITGDWLLAIDTSADFLVQLPFDAKAAAQHLGVTRDHILRLRLGPTHCTQPGWGYSDVRAAFALTESDMQQLGIDIHSMLQIRQTIR